MPACHNLLARVESAQLTGWRAAGMLRQIWVIATMALDFLDQDAIYNPNHGRLRIYAHDGPISLMFAVLPETLHHLERVETMPVGELAAAYRKHKQAIRAAAERRYQVVGASGGFPGAIEIGPQHLGA
jgi:hypothetical protein